MSDPLILSYDLECSPALTWTYDLWPKFIGIDQVVEHPRVISFAAQFKQGDRLLPMVFKSEFHQSRQEMLETLWEMQDRADYVMGWNSQGFDDPYSMGEFALEGLGRPSQFVPVDLMRVEKKHMRLLSRKLDYAAIRFLKDRKDPVNALKAWLEIKEAERQVEQATSREGRVAAEKRLRAIWNKFGRYNRKDVSLLWDVLDQFLPWVDNLNFNLFQEEGSPLVCSKCGSTDLHKRGLYRTGVSTFQVWRCPANHQTRSLKRISGAAGR
jgi:hypothetical protein